MLPINNKYVVALIYLTFPTIVLSMPDSKRQDRTFPEITLPNQANGEVAIKALGDNLPAVAAWYGDTASEFSDMLRADPTAWLDNKGLLFFIDQLPSSTDEQSVAPTAMSLFPLNDTFFLHSRPSANKVIYLDFDGHITTGTAWNISSELDSIVSPPYNSEGDSFSFTDNELAYIQRMWQQVSEDFAPFNVDITTEEPDQSAITRSTSTDEDYGIRVVITEDFRNCGCGGLSYVGAFDYVGDKYKPAFVFNGNLPGSGKAVSHEIGHTLGLSHDGIVDETLYYEGHGEGATGWAPMMGIVYYKQLVQWSKGEYNGANQTENDIERIVDRGLAPVMDDHSDVQDAGSTPLDTTSDGTNVTLVGSGVIERKEDIDVFSILGGPGNYSIIIDPAQYSPNLDILAQLYDNSGYLVASSNPEDSLQAIISAVNLAAGQYFLKIDGIGKGDPLVMGYSDYGSLGRYTVRGTIPDPGNFQAPVASASASYTPGYAPLTVMFDAAGSNDPYGYIENFYWDFGDGNNSFGENTSHVYTTHGDYTATLTVTDNDGISRSTTVKIKVENQTPIAYAKANIGEGVAPYTIEEGSQVILDASASIDPDSDTIQFKWRQKAGIPVTLSDRSSVKPSFVAPAVDSTSTLSFVVTVTDGDLSSTSEINIEVTDIPPVQSDSHSSSIADDDSGGGLLYLLAVLAFALFRKSR